MILTPEQALAHFATIRDAEPGWEDSQQALLAAENDLVPLLLETIKPELAKNELGYHDGSLVRMHGTLAAFGDARTLLYFLRLSKLSYNGSPIALFNQVMVAVEERASAQDIAVLTDLLARSAPPYNDPQRTESVVEQLLGITPPDRVRLAATLVRIAERDPKPELRAALPLLRYNVFAPFEFILLHRRLKSALGRKGLPIPASAENKTEGLPLPAHSRPVNEASPEETKSGYPLGAD